MTLAPGTKLGPYRIVESIGAGGMGEVYKSEDTRLGRTVAVKVLPAHLSDNAELRERLEREARAISSLNHPHICTVHDVGRENGVDFIVMELLEGETLAERLTRRALSWNDALRYGVEIADALDQAHQNGVIHRDVKPGNIMLGPGGAKLLDFGLAKQERNDKVADVDSATPTQQRDLTSEGAVLGTFRYMAPEQLEGRDVDARTDIFAFGVVLYEMVTGRKAFDGRSQASLTAAILDSEPDSIATSTALDWIVRTAMAKDPDDRWRSKHDVSSSSSGSRTSVIPTSLGPRARAPFSRGLLPRSPSALLLYLYGPETRRLRARRSDSPSLRRRARPSPGWTPPKFRRTEAFLRW